MRNNLNDDHDFDKVANLLTPKYPRKCDFAFSTPNQKRPISKIWTISGIAAMFAVVLTLVIKLVVPVSAAEMINSVITSLKDAECVKVEFAWRGIKADSEEIYTPDPSGSLVDGTLYVMRINGKFKTRIDWHDAEKNSIVFNGKDYIYLRNNEIINKKSSSFGETLMNLFSYNKLPDDLKDKVTQTTDGNIIKAEIHKGDVAFLGEFNRNSKLLNKASVSVSMPNGQNLKMMETKSIEINGSIPDSIFIE